MSGEYRFAFRLEAARIEVRIDYWDGGERMLSTSVGGSLGCWTRGRCGNGCCAIRS